MFSFLDYFDFGKENNMKNLVIIFLKDFFYSRL